SHPVVAQSMESHAASLPRDGTLLVSGGFRCCGITIDTAEIYRPAALVPPPLLLSLSGAGRGPGATQHADTYQAVSAHNRAATGDYLVIYCSGLTDGNRIPPQVAIGGRRAEVLWFGKTPGFEGLNQMNVRVPDGIVAGSGVPVRLSYLGRPSN